ncbi:beta-2-microglobulin [Heteronotia binoei]|uniref:beta-2-microglobulin n=1 Tax=Heteronotia binoei TaxID=13085 RepID=UPI00292D646B|nr:beta-2-microglobulin [Heteronotia binoei]
MAKAKEVALWCVLVAFCIYTVKTEKRTPSVQVFTRYPVEFGKENILQCYVDGFHPPKISVTLLKNGKKMDCQQSDLSFHSNWAFFQLFHANVTIDEKDEYAFRVEHETFSEPKIFKLEVY